MRVWEWGELCTSGASGRREVTGQGGGLATRSLDAWLSILATGHIDSGSLGSFTFHLHSIGISLWCLSCPLAAWIWEAGEQDKGPGLLGEALGCRPRPGSSLLPFLGAGLELSTDLFWVKKGPARSSTLRILALGTRLGAGLP